MSNGGSGVDKALRAVGPVRAVGFGHTQSAGGGGGGGGSVGGEGGGGGEGLGKHWKPLNTSYRLKEPEPKAEGGEQWGQWGGQTAEGGGGGEGGEGGGGLGTHKVLGGWGRCGR